MVGGVSADCRSAGGNGGVRLKESLATHPHSRWRRNLMQSTRASVIAFMVPLAATPILTRLYSPEDFAAAAVFNGLLVMVAGLGSWRLDWMIPNAVDADEATALAVTGAGTGVLVAALMIGAIWIVGDYVQGWRGAVILGPLLFLLPIGVLALTLRDLLNAWYVRKADLQIPSAARIAHALGRTGVSVGGGVVGAGPSGLILGQIAGAAATVGVLSGALRELVGNVRALNRATMRRVRGHVTQASLSVAVTMVLNASQMIVPILLVQYYSDVQVGWYSLMQRVAVGPLGVITTALGQSFWAEAAQLARQDRGTLRALYFRTTRRLLLMSIPLVLLCVAGPLYIGAVFGRGEWADAGYVLQAMAPVVLGTLVFAPLNHLVVHRRQAWQLIADGCRLVLVSGVIVVSSLVGIDFVLVVLLTSIASLIGYLILFALHWKVLR